VMEEMGRDGGKWTGGLASPQNLKTKLRPWLNVASAIN